MANDTFSDEEAQEIVEIAIQYSEQFEEDDVDPAIMFEASLLATALYACGAEGLDDEDIIESFREAVKQARTILEDGGVDSDVQ